MWCLVCSNHHVVLVHLHTFAPSLLHLSFPSGTWVRQEPSSALLAQKLLHHWAENTHVMHLGEFLAHSCFFLFLELLYPCPNQVGDKNHSKCVLYLSFSSLALCCSGCHPRRSICQCVWLHNVHPCVPYNTLPLVVCSWHICLSLPCSCILICTHLDLLSCCPPVMACHQNVQCNPDWHCCLHCRQHHCCHCLSHHCLIQHLNHCLICHLWYCCGHCLMSPAWWLGFVLGAGWGECPQHMDYVVIVVANVIDLVWVGMYHTCIHSCGGIWSKIGIMGSSILDAQCGCRVRIPLQ